MTEQDAPSPLHAHTLETLCSALIAGQSVCVEATAPHFGLRSPAARSMLAWYCQHRDKWARNVAKEDVEALVQQLDQDPPPQLAAGSAVTAARRVLYLKSARIHRFKGVHRFGSLDEPPPVVEFELTKKIMLAEGINGAGKTSWLSTILWCLTGLVFRPDGPPEPTAQPVHLSVDGLEDGDGGIEHTMSPVTPLPSAEVLRGLGDKLLPLDTWVELSFVDEQGQDAGTLMRSVKRSRGNVTLTEPDFAKLGLDPLSREIGTRMPALIPYLPLGDRSDLGKAIADLIGIKPLQDLARHAEKVVGRLRKDMVKERREEIKRHDDRFQQVRQKLAALLADHAAFNPGGPLPEPDGADTERALVALKAHFDRLRCESLAEAQGILGDGFDASNAAAGQDLLKSVGAAQHQLEEGQVERLESARRLAGLTRIPPDALAAAEAVMREILAEADALAELARHPEAAMRLRLYVMVAGWLKEQGQGAGGVENCPLCRAPLADRVDDVTSRPVVEHLAEELGADRSHVGQALGQWIKHAHVRLAGIHEALRAEARRDLPAAPAGLIIAAISEELFAASCFRGTLAILKTAGCRLGDKAAAGLPDFTEPQALSLPVCFREEAAALLQELCRVVRAVAFARWCRAHEGKCRAAFAAVIGGLDDGAERADGAGADAPLGVRLAALARIVKHTAPLSEALECVRGMAEAVKDRRDQEGRITRYGQAADALEELCGLSALVEKEVSFLTRTLSESMVRWKARLFMPAFAGAPAAVQPQVEADGVICLDAEADGVRAPAQFLSHKSELRATLFAFLLAFWEYLLDTRGGLALLLLDDPQEFYDVTNQKRIASTIPAVAAKGAQVIVTTFDQEFRGFLLAAAARELAAC